MISKALKWKILFTASKRSLRRLCFYTFLSVILFTGGLHREGGDSCIQGGLHRVGGGCADTSATSDTTGYGQLAGGTHPSRMHSCLFYFQLC